MILECTALGLTSFLFAEVLTRSKIKLVLSLQSFKNAKINIKKIASNIGKKGSSGIILSLGGKTFNLHHSRLGWILAGISVILANISILSVSLGLIVHHIIRERKIF